MHHYKNTYRTGREVAANQNAVATNSDPNWCNRRTRLEKCTTWALCFTVCLVIAISVVLALYLTTDILELNKHASSKCETEECLETAAELIHSIKEDIDPCEDFHKFSCGKTKKTSKSTNFPHENEQKFLQKIEKTLEFAASPKDAKTTKLARTYYRSCMNHSETEEDELTGLLNLLDPYGGWPLAVGENWTSNATYVTAMQLNKFFGFATDHLLKISFRKDFRNASRNVIYIEPPISSASLDPVEEITSEHFEYHLHLATLFGAPNSSETKLAVENLLNLDKQLTDLRAKLNKISETSLKYTLEVMKMRELKQKISSIHWIDYIKEIADMDKIVKNQEAVVTLPEYLDVFKLLLKKANRRNLMDYLVWKIILEMIPYLPRLHDKMQNLKASYGIRNAAYMSRKEFCANAAVRDLPFAKNYLLPERNLIQTFSFEPNGIISFISSTLKDRFHSCYEMDNETCEVAKRKLSNLKIFLGTDAEMVDSFYQQMDLPTNSTYLNTYRNLFIYKERQKNLLRRINESIVELMESGDSIQAFYSEKGNFIYFPLEAISRLYKRNRPNYIQFSRLGFITAFLSFQIMDNLGRQFDDKEVIKTWWTEKSEEKLNQRMSCYLQKETNITEITNFREIKWTVYSILEGIRQSYISYQSWKDTYVKEQELVGIKYASGQLFWLSFAQLMCTDEEDEVFGKSPAWNLLNIKDRVNIPLRKNEAFSRDWECCRDDHMYFKDKCR